MEKARPIGRKKAAGKDLADVGIRGIETVIKEEIKIKARRDNHKRKLARMQIAEEALQIGTRKRNNPKKRKPPIEF